MLRVCFVPDTAGHRKVRTPRAVLQELGDWWDGRDRAGSRRSGGVQCWRLGWGGRPAGGLKGTVRALQEEAVKLLVEW